MLWAGMGRRGSLRLRSRGRLHGKDDRVRFKGHREGDSLNDSWEIGIPGKGNTAR